MNNYTRILLIFQWKFFWALFVSTLLVYINFPLQLERAKFREWTNNTVRRRWRGGTALNRSKLLPNYGSDCREIAAASRRNNSKLIAVLAVIIFSYAQRSPRDRRLHFYKIMTVVKILSCLLIPPVPATRSLLIRTGYSFSRIWFILLLFKWRNLHSSNCNPKWIFLFSFFDTFTTINNILNRSNYISEHKNISRCLW